MNETEFLKEHPGFNQFSDRKGFDVAIDKDSPLQPQVDEFMERVKAELRRQIHKTQLDKQKVKEAIKKCDKLSNMWLYHEALEDLKKELGL